MGVHGAVTFFLTPDIKRLTLRDVRPRRVKPVEARVLPTETAIRAGGGAPTGASLQRGGRRGSLFFFFLPVRRLRRLRQPGRLPKRSCTSVTRGTAAISCGAEPAAGPSPRGVAISVSRAASRKKPWSNW